MSDIAVWTLTKDGHGARAVAREIAGVGIELRYYWDEELRQSQVYRNGEELAAAASVKREQLIANGWTDVPKLACGN
jgi:hypothetical protein